MAMNGTKSNKDIEDYSFFQAGIGKLFLWLNGWKIAPVLPAAEKYILIAEPHTSNWDLVFMLATMFVLRRRVNWIGKHTIFKKPFGSIMRWLGGIPIDRSKPGGIVGQIAEKYRQSSRLIIAISPSGTRKIVQYWKSGFYRMAVAAQVPITCGYLDYSRKTAGLGLSFLPTGDVQADMQRIRDFYKGIEGRNAHSKAAIRLREESN